MYCYLYVCFLKIITKKKYTLIRTVSLYSYYCERREIGFHCFSRHNKTKSNVSIGMSIY